MLPPIRHAIPLSSEGGRALAAELAAADARRATVPDEQQVAEDARERREREAARRRVASGRSARRSRRARAMGA